MQRVLDELAKAIPDARTLPVRCTGSVRELSSSSGQPNIERAIKVFDVMKYQRPSLVTMQDEACFCAAQAKHMTNMSFLRYSVENKIIFDFNNGNECGKGSAEGGIQVFDYISPLRAALELQSYKDLEQEQHQVLHELISLFKLNDAFKAYFKNKNEECVENVSNGLNEIHARLMKELLAHRPADNDEEPLIPEWDEDLKGWNAEDLGTVIQLLTDAPSDRRRRLIHTCYRKTAVLEGLMNLIDIQRRQ